MVLVDSGAFSPQLTTHMVKAIKSRCFMVPVTELLESLEYFIDLCDDAELNRREILQSKRDFITLR